MILCKGKKQIEYKPVNTSDSTIVQYTDSFILDKSMKITVPNQYVAIVFDDEKISFRVEPCVGKVIYKEYGKNFLGHTMKIAFVHNTAIPEMLWGFGNIQVNNDRLKEAYRIGANGTFQVKITDFIKLISSFTDKGIIVVDDVKDRVITLIKMIGIEVLSSYFANTDVSVFEISSLVSEMRDRIVEKIVKETKLLNMGIAISALTVTGIYVPKEDLELIRSRINDNKQISTSEGDNKTNFHDDMKKLQSDILNTMSEEISKSESRNKAENEKIINDKINNNHDETVAAAMKYVDEQLREFDKNLTFELDERIQEMLPLREEAKEENISSLDVTAENLIKAAKCDDDYVPVAAIIYSNVEDNLIHKFDLPHENEKFLINFDDYTEIAEEAKIGDRYLLKKRNGDGTFRMFMPRVYKKDKNGQPLIVESLPFVRFIQAGLSVEKAWEASEMWTALNEIRHKSDENKKKLSLLFEKENKTQKEYLLSALKFYKENGLYTKE